MEVGLVHQHNGLGRAAGYFHKLRARRHGAGKAVGIGDGDDAGLRGNGGEQSLVGELEIVGGLDWDHMRGSH